MTRIVDGRDAGAFITASLDDFGLDVYSFRIYARIVRRAGTKKGCFESIDNMAKACRINRDTVYKSLKLLIKHRLIEKERNSGRPSSYYLTPPSEWIPLPDLSHKRDTLPIPNMGHHLSHKRDTPIPNMGHPPIPQTGHKGINKRDQEKDHHEGWKNSDDADAVGKSMDEKTVDGQSDPFYTGQARQLAREVVKVSRELNAPKNFITDSPWGRLADELGKDPLGVWQQFEAFMLAVNADKKDPIAYCGKVANNLYSNPGSELACKPWLEFADYFRKNLSAPPAPKKSESAPVQIDEIPDREASKEAFRRLKR